MNYDNLSGFDVCCADDKPLAGPFVTVVVLSRVMLLVA